MKRAEGEGGKGMEEKKADFQEERLAALEKAEQQQLLGLSQQREAALESAKHWENLTRLATAGLSEAQAAALPKPPVSPTVLVEAHFAYLESVLKAQTAFTRTLLAGSGKQ